MDQTILLKVLDNYTERLLDDLGPDGIRVVLREFLRDKFFKTNGQIDESSLIYDMIDAFDDEDGSKTVQFLVDNGVDHEAADDLISTY